MPDKSYMPWTKIDDYGHYQEIQNDIKALVSGSKLEFDFKYRGLKIGEEPVDIW